MAFQPGHIIIRAPTTLPMPLHMGGMGIPIGIQPVVAFHQHRQPQHHHNNHQNHNPGVVQPIPGQPTTTVFIGNISECVPDNLIKQILIKCGPIVSWKRVQDASGKMQAFGFCEYRDPGATLRALRILKDLEIADKGLLVKVDQKTKELLDDHIKKRKTKLKLPENDSSLDERSKKEDEYIVKEIKGMIAANKDLFIKSEESTESSANKLADKALKRITGQKVDGESEDSRVNLDAEHASLVEREIRSFRDTYKDKTPERPRGRRDRRSRDRDDGSRDRSRSGSRSRSTRPSPPPPPRRSADRARGRSEDRRRARRSVSRDRTTDRATDRTTDRATDRAEKRRSPSRDRRRRYESEDDEDRRKERREESAEDAAVRKRLEKKKRLKYEAYRKRLDGWELRERSKRREYEAYEDVEAERREEQTRERKKIATFLEDYEDERDDEKYYRGSALARRIREREREMESDKRDRKKEKEETEELRRRLQEEYPDKDPDELIAKLKKDDDSSDESPVSSPAPTSRSLVPNLSEIALPSSNARSRSLTPAAPAPPDTIIIKQPVMKAVPSKTEPATTPGPVFGFQMKSKATSDSSTGGLAGKRRKLEVSSVFNQDEEEDNGEQRHKLKLSLPSEEDKRLTDSLIKNNPLGKEPKENPLPKGSEEPPKEEKPAVTAEDKRKSIKQLIDKIPTQKEELFDYPLDWNVLDKDLMERRVKNWINKKIVEYIGEEEPSLCGFICSKVLAKSPPQNILQDVAIVLEEEAEVFVVKMWRLLIYETEAKKLGLVK